MDSKFLVSYCWLRRVEGKILMDTQHSQQCTSGINSPCQTRPQRCAQACGQPAHLKSPAGSMRSGHTIMAAMKMTMTAMTVGLRKRAISAVSASLSTADASRAPAFLT